MTNGTESMWQSYPLTVSVNVDVEWLDAEKAGGAGLYGRYW